MIARIEREEGVDRQTARAWFEEMLLFVDMCARSDRTLSPPPNVDKAWHAFLLHSRDYESHCRERFGKVVHHQPMGEADPEAYRRAYADRVRYGRGAPDPLIWAVPTGFVAADFPAGEDDQQPRARDAGGGVSGGGDSGSESGADGGSGDAPGAGGSDAGGSDSGGWSGGGGDAGGGGCGGGGCGGGS